MTNQYGETIAESMVNWRSDDEAADPAAIAKLFNDISDLVAQIQRQAPPNALARRATQTLSLVQVIGDWWAIREHERRQLERLINEASPAIDLLEINALVVGMVRARQSFFPDADLGNGIRESFVSAANEIEQADHSLWLERASKATLNRIQALEATAREAVGKVGTDSLAAHYESRATTETRVAETFRVLGLALIIVAAVVAATTPVGESSVELDAVIRHGGWTLSALLVSGYLLRQSGQHRFVAREYRSSQVRLQTLMAYAEGLVDSDRRTNFLEAVGTVMFTARTPHPGEPGDATQLDSALARVADIVQTSRPGK